MADGDGNSTSADDRNGDGKQLAWMAPRQLGAVEVELAVPAEAALPPSGAAALRAWSALPVGDVWIDAALDNDEVVDLVDVQG
ncbi:MAG: hypothetical protein EOP37_03315 [Rubrivivax sp.]|nr:MAG: hypothetical protein EOP37_03315 [Rubrivivax sp.]